MNIEAICRVIDSGGLVIAPTDTIYGIMGDATNEEAIKKVYDVKKRQHNKPLILLMDSIEMVEKYTGETSSIEKTIMNKFWPGLVTIILKKNDSVNELVTAGMDTVGIRIPDNEDLLKIIRKLDRPIISTSANVAGEDVITNLDMINKKLCNEIDYIEDGGELSDVASTVIRVVDGNLLILRKGKLAKEIEKYIEML